MMHNRVVLKEY